MHSRHQERLRRLGLSLNLSKSSCFIHPDHRPPNFDLLRGTIREGNLTNSDGVVTSGIKFYGAPIGEKAFVQAFLDKAALKIGTELSTIEERMDPDTRLSPEIPSRQCLWQLILRCLQFRGNYLARHVPPQFTGTFCDSIDAKINSLINTAIGVNLNSTSPFNTERCRLPVCMKGLGVRDMNRRRHSEYIGALIQGLPPLLDRSTHSGATKPGRLHTPGILRMLGEGSFNPPPDDTTPSTPWTTLLSHCHHSAIATGLQTSWSAITTEFNNLSTWSTAGSKSRMTRTALYFPSANAHWMMQISFRNAFASQRLRVNERSISYPVDPLWNQFATIL